MISRYPSSMLTRCCVDLYYLLQNLLQICDSLILNFRPGAWTFMNEIKCDIIGHQLFIIWPKRSSQMCQGTSMSKVVYVLTFSTLTLQLRTRCYFSNKLQFRLMTLFCVCLHGFRPLYIDISTDWWLVDINRKFIRRGGKRILLLDRTCDKDETQELVKAYKKINTRMPLGRHKCKSRTARLQRLTTEQDEQLYWNLKGIGQKTVNGVTVQSVLCWYHLSSREY